MADTGGGRRQREGVPPGAPSELEVAKALGARLRALRERAGITQERASQIAGISRNHYQLLELGLSDRAKASPANPRLRTLVALCQAYETTMPQLMIEIFSPPLDIVVDDDHARRSHRGRGRDERPQRG